MRYIECENCGGKTYLTYKFCPYCGTKLIKPVTKISEETTIIELCSIMPAYNARWILPKNGIQNLRDLCQKSAIEIYSLKGISKTSLNAIISTLNNYGYSLRKMDDDATTYLKNLGIKA